MTPASPAIPADRRERAKDHEQRLAALRIHLQEVAHQIRTAEDWTRCLQAVARLHGESWANILLISSQNPGVTLVQGYQAWRAAGRQVNRDEQGIEIFSSAPRQEEGGHSWRDANRVAYVWDLSQTGGPPLPVPAAIPSPPGEGIACLLRPLSDRLLSAALPGKDPAEILETDGATILRAVLRHRAQPLSAVVIDAHIAPWERRLQGPEGPLLAMRSVATVIAGLLPAQAATAIKQITRNKELLTFDDRLLPVANPELPEIARALPADTAYQITRAAERLGFTDYSEVLTEVANAVTRKPASENRPAQRDAAAGQKRLPAPAPDDPAQR